MPPTLFVSFSKIFELSFSTLEMFTLHFDVLMPNMKIVCLSNHALHLHISSFNPEHLKAYKSRTNGTNETESKVWQLTELNGDNLWMHLLILWSSRITICI